MSDRTAQARVEQLESEVAFQGQMIRELNDALGLQQQDLLTLQRQLSLLGEQLRALRETGVAAPDADGDSQEKPPHY